MTDARRLKIDYTTQRYLPATSEAALSTPNGSLGMAALAEGLAGGANDAARIAMARCISKVGRKYTAEARATAARIASGADPLPPIPHYMLKAVAP